MKIIKQYDEVVGEEFSIPEFSLANYSSEHKFFEVERRNIFEAIYVALVVGVQKKHQQVPVFSVLEAEAVITIEKYDYLFKCEECIKFFEGIEEYTHCHVLTQLKEKICQEIQELNI